jgi:peptide-methionine (R)-S-oxide reductase
MTHKIPKTDEEWKEILTSEQFDVCRKKGTERAFTGIYWDTKDNGVYRCTCCSTELFSSDTKFDSGTGWPSFFKPVNEENIEYVEDNSFGMRRVEVNCKNCGCHLGHVFDDGPTPTNMRYCINSVSLDLDKSN